MRSHRFINSLLYLVIQLVAEEGNAKGNNAGIRRLFVLFLDKRYISQVIHFKLKNIIAQVNFWALHSYTKVHESFEKKEFGKFLVGFP